MTTGDNAALRRRVLLVAVVTAALYLGLAWTVYWLKVSDAWLIVGLALVYLLVVRPLMRPVREAIKLRRRLAYQAWLDEKARQEEKKP